MAEPLELFPAQRDGHCLLTHPSRPLVTGPALAGLATFDDAPQRHPPGLRQLRPPFEVGASCRDAVRQAIFLCGDQERPEPEDDDGNYCRARAKLPVERLDQIHRHLVPDAQALVTQRNLWCERRVWALDGAFRANTAKRRLDLRRSERLGKDDRLVIWCKGLKPSYMAVEYWAQLPDEIAVRVLRVRAQVPGFRTRSVLLVTTLLDPVKYPASELAKLYLRRWEMEICFRHVKTTLPMDVLSCKTPGMIERELRMHFLVHNVVRRVALEAARHHHVPVQRISFAGAVGAIHSFAGACLQVRSRKRREQMRSQLYELLAGDLVPERTESLGATEVLAAGLGDIKKDRYKKGPVNYVDPLVPPAENLGCDGSGELGVG